MTGIPKTTTVTVFARGNREPGWHPAQGALCQGVRSHEASARTPPSLMGHGEGEVGLGLGDALEEAEVDRQGTAVARDQSCQDGRGTRMV